MRRVVVTGLGMVTPLGFGVQQNWKRLTESQSGIRAITDFDVSDLPAKIGGRVPLGKEPGEFDSETVISSKERRRMDDFIVFAMAAAQEAVHDSGWAPQDEDARERTGVMIGSGIGGLPSI